METLREKLIGSIVLLSEDELEMNDFYEMAKESEEELIERILHIAIRYKDENNYLSQFI
jgi:predicted Zn-ribbon and HTH transcriptional regulator